jgi:uncharacterized protein YcbK (DUF882 family)
MQYKKNTHNKDKFRTKKRKSDTKSLKKNYKLSEHFSRKDFYCKSGLDKNNSNFRISAGLVGALELIRSIANTRINIIKGFECSESAEKKGKVARNFHVQGLAANITADDLSLNELAKIANSVPEISGICLNLDQGYVHIRTNKSEEKKLWVIKDTTEIDINEGNIKTFFYEAIKPN